MLLIGSKALRHWLPTSRPGMDHDFIATRTEFDHLVRINEPNITHRKSSHDGIKYTLRISGKPVEVELVEPGSANEIILDLASKSEYVSLSVFQEIVQIADPAILLIIKKSHQNLPINWWKHVTDYHRLKALNPVITDTHRKAMALRKIEAETRWGKMPKPNLMVPNEEFFGQSQKVVNRIYVHDDLHFSTCFYERPLYEKLKTDQSLAWCDRKLFEALSHGDRVKCVQEEAFSIALERKVIPAMNENKEFSADLAFRHAVERIGTTLTSGWFREFTQENAIEILDHKTDYVGKFLAYLERRDK